MFGMVAPEPSVEITLYTDAYLIRGSVRSRLPRVTDILNRSDEPFIVVEQVTVEEIGARGDVLKAEYAQVNLASVLFAISDTPVDTSPELRVTKMTEEAIVTIPPYKITGRIHLLQERQLRDALTELTGRFVPVTSATFWSDVLGVPRQQTLLVAVNHDRAQIMAPHRVVDPWAGLSSPPAE